MRLAIEALGVKYGGGATVLTDLLQAAIADSRFERIYVLCSPRQVRRFSFPESPRIVEVECALAEGNKLYRLWWIEHRLPAYLHRVGCNGLLCLSGCGNGGSAAPHVTVIQQALPFSPQAIRGAGILGALRLWGIRQGMKRSCHSSRRVIVQTHTMKNIVGQAFSLPPDRILVVTPAIGPPPPLAQSNAALAPMRAAAPGFRVLYVGNQSPYKNVNLLLQAAVRLATDLPELSVFLTWPSDPAAAPDRNGVVRLGYLNPAELAEAYSLADAFVLPSLEETVGVPLLEAMSAGVPVLAADLPYAREVCGSAASFFDPHDVSALVSALRSVLTGAELRSSLIAEGLRLAEQRRASHPYKKMLDVLVTAISTP